MESNLGIVIGLAVATLAINIIILVLNIGYFKQFKTVIYLLEQPVVKKILPAAKLKPVHFERGEGTSVSKTLDKSAAPVKTDRTPGAVGAPRERNDRDRNDRDRNDRNRGKNKSSRPNSPNANGNPNRNRPDSQQVRRPVGEGAQVNSTDQQGNTEAKVSDSDNIKIESGAADNHAQSNGRVTLPAREPKISLNSEAANINPESDVVQTSNPAEGFGPEIQHGRRSKVVKKPVLNE